MGNSAGVRRWRWWQVLVLVGGLIAPSCGTSAADVAPEIDAACDAGNADLLSLASEEPTVEVSGATSDFLFDIFLALPDVDTDAGIPNRVLGNGLQGLRRLTSDIRTASSGLAERPFDAIATEQAFRDEFAEVNDGAATFGLSQCLSPSLLDDLLLPQIGLVTAAIEDVAPTGDFDVDIAAVCARYRAGEAELAVANLLDENAEFLIFVRLRDLADELTVDLSRLTVPADRQADVDAVISGVARLRAAGEAASDARRTTQEQLDQAVAAFENRDAELNALLDTLHPGC